MYKLAAFTDEISFDFEHACGVVAAMGGLGVELRRGWDTPVEKLTDAQVRDVKRVVEDNGLVVCSVASPFGKCDLDNPEEVRDHMDILRRCADIGRALDCSLVRGFAFWDRDQIPVKPWEKMVRAYEPVAGILEEKAVTLGIENEAACYVGTAGHLRKFLDYFDTPRIKAIWDLANHVQDPQGDDTPPYPDGYELIKDDIVHVHAKDAIRIEGGGRPNVFLGVGICDWPGQLQALRDDGYEGYVSLETHVMPDRFPESFQSKYGKLLYGEGRDGREGASRVCLAWLRETIDSLA